MWLKSIFPTYIFYKSLSPFCPLAAALSLNKISHNWEYIQISFNFYIGSTALSRSASLPFLRRSDFRYRSDFLSLSSSPLILWILSSDYVTLELFSLEFVFVSAVSNSRIADLSSDCFVLTNWWWHFPIIFFFFLSLFLWMVKALIYLLYPFLFFFGVSCFWILFTVYGSAAVSSSSDKKM